MVSSMKENLGLTVMHLQVLRCQRHFKRHFLRGCQETTAGSYLILRGHMGCCGSCQDQILRVVDTPGWSSDPKKMENSLVIFFVKFDCSILVCGRCTSHRMRILQIVQSMLNHPELLWMEEILHHLGWLKPYK